MERREEGDQLRYGGIGASSTTILLAKDSKTFFDINHFINNLNEQK